MATQVMAKKIVTVVGATGIQGGSVIDILVKDDKYRIRAVTRNCQSQSAKDLVARGVEVVQATTNDVSSLTAAFQGSSIIFGSSGKYLVPHFESKNVADRYIQSQQELFAKTTFVIIGYYAANFYWQTHTPISVPSAGKYVQLNGYPADTPLRPIGDAKNNVGIFIKAIIDQPNKTLPRKHVLAHTENITCGEMLQLWAEAQGKPAEYIELQPEDFNKIWPGWAEEIGIMMQFFWWAKVTRSQNDGVLSRSDLGISTGLIGTKEAFSTMKF
ncbi:hypothetical protein TrVFT333_004612 [Trichoderma virens FT-333]|nr:hypothetical protein TrVFT333_004612 [Trichoderma virens FT-333]